MLTATFEDPKGGSQIAEVVVSVMSNDSVPGGKSKWSRKECLVRYDLGSNAIWLVPNMGGTWGYHSATAGSSSPVSNSQCTVVAAGSSAEVSGNTVTVRLEMTFAPEYAGAKRIFLQSEDVKGAWNADYQKVYGSFTVAAAGMP
jgi:hypothetical protein